MLEMKVFAKWGSKTPMEDIFFVNGEVTGKNKSKGVKVNLYYVFLLHFS